MVLDEGVDINTVDRDVLEAIIDQDEYVGHKGVRVCLSVVEKYVKFLKNLDSVQSLLGKRPTFDVEKVYETYRLEKEERDKEEKEKKEREERERMMMGIDMPEPEVEREVQQGEREENKRKEVSNEEANEEGNEREGNAPLLEKKKDEENASAKENGRTRDISKGAAAMLLDLLE